jgi:hypothetical protein
MFFRELGQDVAIRQLAPAQRVDDLPLTERLLEVDMKRPLDLLRVAADGRAAHRRERDDAVVVLIDDDVVDVLVARGHEPQLQPPRLPLAMGREAARREPPWRVVQRRRNVLPALVIKHGADGCTPSRPRGHARVKWHRDGAGSRQAKAGTRVLHVLCMIGV